MKPSGSATRKTRTPQGMSVARCEPSAGRLDAIRDLVDVLRRRDLKRKALALHPVEPFAPSSRPRRIRTAPALSDIATRFPSRSCSLSTVKPSTSRYHAVLARTSFTVNDADRFVPISDGAGFIEFSLFEMFQSLLLTYRRFASNASSTRSAMSCQCAFTTAPWATVAKRCASSRICRSCARANAGTSLRCTFPAATNGAGAAAGPGARRHRRASTSYWCRRWIHDRTESFDVHALQHASVRVWGGGVEYVRLEIRQEFGERVRVDRIELLRLGEPDQARRAEQGGERAGLSRIQRRRAKARRDVRGFEPRRCREDIGAEECERRLLLRLGTTR